MTYRPPQPWLLATVALAALAASALMAIARPVEMIVDGRRIESDVPPVTLASDRVFVPLRRIAGALGALTVFDEKAGTVDVLRGKQSLRIRVGDPRAVVDGKPATLRQPPFRVRGRVMIGLNVVSSAFDVRVNYDRRTARITVLTSAAPRDHAGSDKPSGSSTGTTLLGSDFRNP